MKGVDGMNKLDLVSIALFYKLTLVGISLLSRI